MFGDMGMHKSKNLAILLLLLMIFGSSQCTRDFGFHSHNHYPQKYARVFATLGVECRCCDGASSNERCKSIWEGSCSKLQCLSWKDHRV
ncbi:hypothetical protein HanRHA438_Chr08g0345001 [Helianthus annuus]|uniref:Uncharacterized protein n=1 Tax=Helianthus annuus TaxID=4232 RepID=A0A251U566_HELAN|nr:hypothetical protein HanXRQr2_Chr08g0333671 [Helianthus annuus]KAJ0546385.1 hypothetical protein HanIR_Chr08g0360341 [Helianthus annuus]KAJ0897373.1 hypothetical protein HanRHA438_Chr08g0345001 [Helianthus annuus]